jgi:hypothetical protein
MIGELNFCRAYTAHPDRFGDSEGEGLNLCVKGADAVISV